MKTLIVYYSRTGATRKVAESISNILSSDTEEIVDTKNRAGVLGWLSAGKDAGSKKLTKIEETKKDPTLYELVIIGTPVWNGTVSSPVRTYISQNKDKFQRVAFFCTCDSSEGNAFKEMESVCGRGPVATFKLNRKEVEKDEHYDKVKQFIANMA